MDHLVQFYKTSRARKQNFDETYDVDAPRMTARTLEGLVRISEAHARLYLREEATIEDAKMAIAVVKHWRHEAAGDEFDEITLRTGVTRNKRSAERVITSVVRNLIREMGGECATTDVYNATTERGYDEDTTDRVLATLRTRGTLWCPRLDIWRLA